MADTYGDGWNGAYWTWTSTSNDAVEATGTLASGSSGTALLCGTGCYTFEIGTQGSYPHEIGWSIGDYEASGGVDDTAEICLGSPAPSVTYAPTAP